MHGKQWVGIAISFSVAMVTTSLAVNPGSPVPRISAPPPAAPFITSQPISAQSALTGTSQPTVTTSSPVASPSESAQIWNLKNADIRAVIQTISILTGKNFVIDPRVQGNITLVSQKPMTPDEMYQVFLSMLQLLQFVAIPSGNVIKIVPATEGAALTHQIATNNAPGTGEEIVVRVVPVQRVSATELVPVLRPLMPQSGSITAYLPSNSLILAGTASNIDRLTKVISEMDNENANQVNVIPLHYASAKKVVDMIKALHSGPGQTGANNAILVPDEEDNSILVNANVTNQMLTRQLIEQLDQPSAGGDDTKVVMLNYLTAKKFAPILSKIASGIGASPASGSVGSKTSTPVATEESDDGGTAVGANGVSIQPEDNNNALIMHAPKAMLTSLMDVIRRLDVPPKEVLVEAIIVKVDENLLNKLGIEWGSPTAALGTSVTNPNGTTTLPGIGGNGTVALKVGSSGVGLLPNGNLMALLHLLKSDGSTDVLSTPSVVVLNNDKATIDDGQNIGVANTTYQSPQPVASTSATTNLITQPYNAIQRQDVTLSLEVTPHISPNKTIRMELLQKDDTVASDPNTTPDNPTLNTSKIKTSVLVKSGDVLVLGGLINNNQEKTTQKIPILGNLPLLGHLFSYDSHKLQKTSLMMFIRPIIMSKNAAQEQTMGRYRYLRDQQIEMRTETAEEFTRMTILPKLGDNRKASLPPPVKSMDLPTPSETEK